MGYINHKIFRCTYIHPTAENYTAKCNFLQLDVIYIGFVCTVVLRGTEVIQKDIRTVK